MQGHHCLLRVKPATGRNTTCHFLLSGRIARPSEELDVQRQVFEFPGGQLPGLLFDFGKTHGV